MAKAQNNNSRSQARVGGNKNSNNSNSNSNKVYESTIVYLDSNNNVTMVVNKDNKKSHEKQKQRNEQKKKDDRKIKNVVRDSTADIYMPNNNRNKSPMEKSHTLSSDSFALSEKKKKNFPSSPGKRELTFPRSSNSFESLRASDSENDDDCVPSDSDSGCSYYSTYGYDLCDFEDRKNENLTFYSEDEPSTGKQHPGKFQTQDAKLVKLQRKIRSYLARKHHDNVMKMKMKLRFGSDAGVDVQNQGLKNNCFSLSVARSCLVLLKQVYFGDKSIDSAKWTQTFHDIVHFIEKNLTEQSEGPGQGSHPGDALLLCLGFPSKVKNSYCKNNNEQYPYEIKPLFELIMDNCLDLHLYSMQKDGLKDSMSESAVLEAIKKSVVVHGRQPVLAYHYWSLDDKLEFDHHHQLDGSRRRAYPQAEVDGMAKNLFSCVSQNVNTLIGHVLQFAIEPLLVNNFIPGVAGASKLTLDAILLQLGNLNKFLEKGIEELLDSQLIYTPAELMRDEIRRQTDGLVERIRNGECGLSATLLSSIDWTSAKKINGKFDFKSDLELLIRESAAMMGHVVNIVSYDAEQKSFVLCNSYGDSWGNRGYFTVAEGNLLHVFKNPIILDLALENPYLNVDREANVCKYLLSRTRLLKKHRDFVSFVNANNIAEAIKIVRDGHMDWLYSMLGGNNRVALVQSFVHHGLDVNSFNENSVTLFHFACLENYPDLAEYLLTIPNLVVDSINSSGGQPIHDCCQRNRMDILQMLLVGGRINLINSQTLIEGASPLHIACSTGNMRLTRYLLSFPSLNTNFYDKNGLLALHAACIHNRLEVVVLLLKDKEERFNRNAVTLRILVEEKKYTSTITPLDIATDKKFNNLRDFLVSIDAWTVNEITVFKSMSKKKTVHRSLLEEKGEKAHL